jgi:thiamine kinase-like enzyme
LTVLLPDALRRIAFLTTADAAAAQRLAGLTNVNYLVHHGTESYVVRLPGAGTSDYINRSDEEVAARSAAGAGVNAEILFFDATDGLMVTRFVQGAVTMSPERFGDLGAVGRAGQALRLLHDHAAPFATDFELFPAIDGYKALLAETNATLPDGYAPAEALAERARAALGRHPATLVPSHCDPLCENFLDTGQRMYIIDFEYAGNNDPMWDLGDFSVEGHFSDHQDRALLESYFGGPAPASAAARMTMYKALSDLLWSLWGLVQHANGNPVEDFWVYAVGRFERCRTLMATPEFREALTELERE